MVDAFFRNSIAFLIFRRPFFRKSDPTPPRPTRPGQRLTGWRMVDLRPPILALFGTFWCQITAALSANRGGTSCQKVNFVFKIDTIPSRLRFTKKRKKKWQEVNKLLIYIYIYQQFVYLLPLFFSLFCEPQSRWYGIDFEHEIHFLAGGPAPVCR